MSKTSHPVRRAETMNGSVPAYEQMAWKVCMIARLEVDVRAEMVQQWHQYWLYK